MSIPTRLARMVRPRREEEQGFFLVFFALILVLLLGVAGLAVDFSNWTYQGQQQQKAADAAALGGAVYLPDDAATAFSTAADVAAKNGYSNTSDGSTKVVIAQGVRPNQLKVTITRTVKNVFAQAIGFTTKTITRTATGEYQKPIAMGSPSNQFGNNPEANALSGSAQYPGFWANVAGPDSPKENGDGYQAGNCSIADNCSGGRNTDYDPKGYSYTVHIGAGAPGSVILQAYDPAFVAVGDTCGKNDDGSNLIGAAFLPQGQIPGYPTGGAAPSERYLPVSNAGDAGDAGLRYCSGDHIFNTGSAAPDTTYKVLGPATIPGDPNSAPSSPICSVTFPGFKGDLVPQLKSSSPWIARPTVAGVPTTFGAMFRAWYPLCAVSGQGDYFIQVSTTGSSGTGHNRFSLCASSATQSCLTTAGVGIYGNAKMSIYANVGTDTLTEFYLARVLPGAPGRTLTLNLFDIGDAANGSTGTLKIVRTRNGADTDLANCSYTPPPGNSTGPPWGKFQPTDFQDCRIGPVTSAQYNGQWIQIRVPIDNTMNSCDATNPNDCWLRIQYRFSGGVNDTTTWSAFIDGDPVRLSQ